MFGSCSVFMTYMTLQRSLLVAALFESHLSHQSSNVSHLGARWSSSVFYTNNHDLLKLSKHHDCGDNNNNKTYWLNVWGFLFFGWFFFSPESRTMNLIQSRSLWNQHDIVQFGFQHLVVIIQIAKFKNQFIFPFFPQVRDPTAADEEQNRFFHDCVWIIKIQMFIVADIFRSYARKFCDSEALYLISLSAYMGKPASVDFSVCC